MHTSSKDAMASTNISSQTRIPDTRLPGATIVASGAADQKHTERNKHHVATAEADHSYELSVLALWPVFVMIGIGVSLGIGTVWYGPTKLLQILLSLLVPEHPHFGHICAIWFAIVGCIVLGVPLLLLLLPVPAMMLGFWNGFLIVATAETVAACLSFVIGRYVAQKPVREFLECQGCNRIMRMLSVMEDTENHLQLLILFRFMAMPMACRNYGPAILDVPMQDLVLSTIPHSLWSALVFATAGSTLTGPAHLLRDGHKIHWQSPPWLQMAGLVIAFVSLTGFGWLAGRAYWRKVEDEDGKRLLQCSEEGSPSQYGTNSEGTRAEVTTSGS